MIIMSEPSLMPPNTGEPSYLHPAGRRFSYLISTIPGEDGTRELDAFASGIGLDAKYMRDRGSTANERYTLYAAKIGAALDAGAKEVSQFEFVSALQGKRPQPDLPVEGAATPQDPPAAP